MPDPSTTTMTQHAGKAPGPAMDRRIGRSRWSRARPWLLAVCGAVALLAAAFALTLVPRSGTLSVASGEITIGVAQNAPFQDYLPVRATVAPLHTVYVGAIEGGQVLRIAVTDGASVKAGDVLATLSNPQLQLDVTSREAAIAGQLGGISAQRLSLAQDQTALDNAIAETGYNVLKARRALDIHERLHQQDFESDAGVAGFADEAHYYATRLANLRAARERSRAIAVLQESELEQTAAGLRRNLQVVDQSLQALILRAPLAGRLTDFLLQPGQTLKQGDSIGQIDSEGAYRLDADVDEYYLGRVAEGQHAAASFGDMVASVRVSRVRPQVANGQFRAELVFDAAPPPGLRRGESVDLRVTLGDTRTALVLPNGPWLEDSGGSFVFVVDAGGRHAARRGIVSGRRNPEQVEITSGLVAGERVVTSSYKRYASFLGLLIE